MAELASAVRRQLLRTVRSVAVTSFTTAASAMGVNRRAAAAALLAPRLRGRCDTAIYAALLAPPESALSGAAAHPLCPPPLRRAAAEALTGPPRGIHHISATAQPGSNLWLRGSSAWISAATRRCMALDTVRAGEEAGSRSGAVPPALLARRAGAARFDVRETVAKDPGCRAQTLWLLTGDVSPRVRHAVAGHRNLPVAVQRRVAGDAEGYVRAGLAANPNCSPGILADLSTDPDARVIRAVSEHALTPVDASHRLIGAIAAHRDAKTRAEAAASVACPQPIVQALSVDTDSTVRAAAARNPNCSPGILDRLCGDAEPAVRCAAAEHPSLETGRCEQIMDSLAASDDIDSRCWAAGSPQCPQRLLWKLTNDDEREVRRALLDNPALPAEVLAALEHDPSDGIAAVAMRLQP